MKLPLSVSLVVYRTPPVELERLFQTLATGSVSEWIVVNNGSDEDKDYSEKLQDLVKAHGGRYLASPENVGFGSGHNLALASQLVPRPEFHLMVNPDITFTAKTLSRLVQEIQARPDVGLIMPKVLYEDGEFQPVCKLLPTPLDFALRRFAPSFLRRIFRLRLARYELEGIENQICEKVPFLSGCFLLARRSVLQKIKGFDSRFFLYLEDVDLCRRIAEHAKLLYWPKVSVFHGCFRGAYQSKKLMFLFLRSAIAYFMKWGWFIDRKRCEANHAALECIHNFPPISED